MNLRKNQRWRARQAVRGGTARLTPAPESSTTDQSEELWIHRPNTGKLRLSPELMEARGKESSLRPGPVVVLITALALIFILIITWLIAHE
jgi:hypothetical protein